MNKASSFYKSEIAETLHLLMEKLPENLVQEKLWKQFHTRTKPEAVDQPKKRFRKHPHRISNSGSDLLSSRNPSETELAGRKVNDLVREKPSVLSINLDNSSDFGDGEIVMLRKDSYKQQIREVRASFIQQEAESKSVKAVKKKVTLTCALDSQNDVNNKKSDDSVRKSSIKKKVSQNTVPVEDSKSRLSEDLKHTKKLYQMDFNEELDIKKKRVSQNTAPVEDPKSRLSEDLKHTKKLYQTDFNEELDIKKKKVSQNTAPVEDSKSRLSEDLRRTKKLYQADFNEEFLDHTDVKLKHIMQKALNCMEDIRLQIDTGYDPPDGSEDLERRKKRALEFASRFARNYLYQLNRQINEIRKLLKPTLGRISFRNCSNVLQKLVSSYQTILQGLNAYHNHLPTTVCLGEPDKVKELLKLCFVLCDIHRNCFSKDINCNNKTHEIIDVFEVRSKHLLDKIEEAFDVKSTVSLAQSNHSKFSLTGPAKDKMMRKKNAMKSRYSMYAVMPTRKDPNWKRAVASLAKKKFNVQSKYKTANFKHRPPIEKPPVIIQLPPKTKTLERKSSANLKPCKYIMNDDIQTMVQVEQEKEKTELCIKESSSDYKSDKSEMLLAPLVEKVLQKLSEENKDMSQDQVKNILQGLTEMVRTCDDVNRLPKTEKDDGDELGGKQLTPPTPPSTATGDAPRSLATSAIIGGPEKEIKREEVNRRGKKQTITVTGVRNAQLICIKDDDSLVEPSEKQLDRVFLEGRRSHPPEDDKTCECNKAQSKISLASSEHASKIKISRLPKRNLTKLKMLPKEHALNVLQYKLEFSKAKKNNPMYKKSSYVQPWKLMGIIADLLLEELLASLGKEIQMNEVIERIYASEFM